MLNQWDGGDKSSSVACCVLLGDGLVPSSMNSDPIIKKVSKFSSVVVAAAELLDAAASGLLDVVAAGGLDAAAQLGVSAAALLHVCVACTWPCE